MPIKCAYFMIFVADFTMPGPSTSQHSDKTSILEPLQKSLVGMDSGMFNFTMIKLVENSKQAFQNVLILLVTELIAPGPSTSQHNKTSLVKPLRKTTANVDLGM